MGFRHPQNANTIWIPAESRQTWNGFADGARHGNPGTPTIAKSNGLEAIAAINLAGAGYDKAKKMLFPTLAQKIADQKIADEAAVLGVKDTSMWEDVKGWFSSDEDDTPAVTYDKKYVDDLNNKLDSTKDPKERQYIINQLRKHSKVT